MKIDYEVFAYAQLKGRYKHYCMEWDGMAIDETMGQFASCLCFDFEDDALANHWRELQRLKRDAYNENS